MLSARAVAAAVLAGLLLAHVHVRVSAGVPSGLGAWCLGVAVALVVVVAVLLVRLVAADRRAGLREPRPTPPVGIRGPQRASAASA